jgi:hypothetical protein
MKDLVGIIVSLNIMTLIMTVVLLLLSLGVGKYDR